MSGLVQGTTTRVGPNVLELERPSDFQATLLGMTAHDLRQPLQVLQPSSAKDTRATGQDQRRNP